MVKNINFDLIFFSKELPRFSVKTSLERKINFIIQSLKLSIFYA